MKTVGIVLLVLLLLLVGLPLAMGMGMDTGEHCPACAPEAPFSVAMCIGILALFALAMGLTSSKLSRSNAAVKPSVSLTSLFRPPRAV